MKETYVIVTADDRGMLMAYPCFTSKAYEDARDSYLRKGYDINSGMVSDFDLKGGNSLKVVVMTKEGVGE